MKIKLNSKIAVFLYIISFIVIAFIAIFGALNSFYKSSKPILEFASKNSIVINKIGKVEKILLKRGYRSDYLNSKTRTVTVWLSGSQKDAKVQLWGKNNDEENWEIDSLKILEVKEK